MAEEGAARLEEPDFSSSNWYFTREEIERLSASRSDGIDHKKESSLRKVYCTYLQELGMQLKMPQVTIATAIVFCHRFFFRQSHARNDKFLIATVCLFLAGKVEETPRPLQEVVKWSYALRHKKDSDAYNRIKSNPPLYEHHRRLILQGEHFLLTIMGFDLNISHPYRPLVTAIRRFKVNNEQNAIAQVAWNFVNDGLRTSLCLQFKPHHIAAGAIFLAAKFLKARLPDGERAWWREFDVTPRQLEEVSNQMLELYEQSKTAGNPGEDHPTPSPGNFSAVENSKKTSPSSVVLSPSFDGAVDGAAVNSRVKPPEVKMEATVSVVSSSVVTEEAREVKQEFKQVKQELKEVNQEIEEAKEIKQEVKQGVLADTTIDEAKLKAALEKRRKRRGESVALAAPKQVVTDEDLLEMALESGIEEAARKRTEDHPSSLEDPEKGAQQIDAEVSEGPAAKRQHTEQHTDDGLTGTAVKPEEGTDPVSKRVGPAKRQHEEDDVGATKRQRTEEEKAEEGEVVADKRDSPRRSYSPKRSYSPRRYSNSPRRYSNSPRRGHDSPRKAFDSPPPHYRPYNEGRRPQRPPPYDRRREYGREYGREQEYGHRNMGNMGRQVYYDHKQQRQNHHRYPPHQGYHSYDRR